MKCEQCNYEAVKIKKNHFCPNCGKKILKNEIKQSISESTPSENSFSILNKENILNKNDNILNLKEVNKNNNFQSPKINQVNIPKKIENKEQENIPSHIKNIIEKHTEPIIKNNKDNNEKSVTKASNINLSKKVENFFVPLEKEKLETRSFENVFSSKNNKVFWDKPIIKKNMIPTKKEKTLKIMLTLVVVLNILVVLGIVYLLLT